MEDEKMKEILFATGNASKVARFKEKLVDKGILLKSLNDLGINLDVEENGKTAIENATIKAKAYYEEHGNLSFLTCIFNTL